MTTALEIEREISLLNHAAGKQRAKALDGLTAAIGTLGVERVSSLMPRIAAMISSDGSDSCREKAALFLTRAVAEAGASQEMADGIAELAARRFAPGVEQTEEARLAVIRLLLTAVESSSASVSAKGADYIKSAVIRGTADRFDEVRIVSCQVAEALPRRDPQKAFMVGDPIVAAIAAPLLQHRKHGVRMAALGAVSALVCCGCTREAEELSKQAVRLCCDSAVAIRQATVSALHRWLLLPRSDLFELFLPALLIALADEVQDVSSLALNAIAQIGDRFNPKTSQPTTPDSVPPLPVYPPPFSSRPAIGARLIVQASLKKTLSWVLENAVNVLEVSGGTIRSLAALRSLLTFSETAVLSVLDPVIDFLCESATSAEAEALVLTCSNIVGWFAGTAAFLPRIFPKLEETTRVVPRRTAACIVLRGLCLGCRPEDILGGLPSIVQAISNLDVCQCGAGGGARLLSLAQAVIDFCVAISALCRGNDSLGAKLFSSVLIASSSDQAAAHSGENAIAAMGTSLIPLGAPGAVLLHDHYFLPVASELASSVAEWNGAEDPRACLFAALLRGSQTALADGAKAAFVATLLQQLATCEKDTLRLLAVDLTCNALEKLGKDSFRQFVQPQFLLGSVALNIVWKPGPVVYQTRKAASTCLSKVLATAIKFGAGDEMASAAASIVKKIVPALEDVDTAVRHDLTNAVSSSISILGNRFPADQVSEAATALVKRLDDTEDSTRIVAVSSVALLLCSVKLPEVTPEGSLSLEQIIRRMFVHLDDLNPAVQSSVDQALREIVPIAPTLVSSIAQESAPKHRSPRLCNEIFALAQSRIFQAP